MSKVSRPSQGKTMENNGLRDKRKRLNHYWYDHHFWYIQYQPITRQLSKRKKQPIQGLGYTKGNQLISGVKIGNPIVKDGNI